MDAVLDSGKRRVALLGLSFKNGSDDLRESPFVTLAEALIGKGLSLRVCDPDVALGQLVGRIARTSTKSCRTWRSSWTAIGSNWRATPRW